MATLEKLSAAEVARVATPHTVVMPDGKRHACATYQEAWLLRRAEAWKAELDPLDIPIEDDANGGARADVTLEDAIRAEHGNALTHLLVLGR